MFFIRNRQKAMKKFLLRCIELFSLLLVFNHMKSQYRIYSNSDQEYVIINKDTVFFMLYPRNDCIYFPLIGKVFWRRLNVDSSKKTYKYKSVKNLPLNEIIQVNELPNYDNSIEFVFYWYNGLPSPIARIEILKKGYTEIVKKKIVVKKRVKKYLFIYFPKIKFEYHSYFNKKDIYYATYTEKNFIQIPTKILPQILNDTIILRFYTYGLDEYPLLIHYNHKYVFKKKINIDYIHYTENNMIFDFNNDTLKVFYKNGLSTLFLDTINKKSINDILNEKAVK